MHTDEARPPTLDYPPFFYVWGQIQFEDFGLHLYVQERAPGSLFYLSGELVARLGAPPLKRARVTGFGQQIAWADDPHGQTLAHASFELTLQDGSVRKLELRARPARYFLKGGLYGGLAGWSQGDDRGPLHLAHETWRHDDPEVRRVARTLSDHVVEARMDGRTGWGILEYGVGKGFPMYPDIQRFPAI